MAQYEALERHVRYQESMYIRRQMRDTVEGTTAVKNSGELYLPIPSSWLELDVSNSPSHTANKSGSPVNRPLPDYLPWNHSNPMYRAYLQRARFPDITGAALRGMLGIATTVEAKVELPANMEDLIEEVCPSGESLQEFFEYCLSEVLTTGKVGIVVDVDVDGEFYLTSYTAESNINWDTRRVKGAVEVLDASFIEDDDYDFEGDEGTVKRFHYVEGVPCYTDYEDGEPITEPTPLRWAGKSFGKLPLFFAGAMENTPVPRIVPLAGISDIAISIYQKRADLSQAHFMTCNPTLFVFGVGDKETPRVVGSNVIVGIRNPQGRAEYPNTDTSALDHIKEDIQDMMKEAASYGANFVMQGKQRESGESLGRQSAQKGTGLVKAVNQTGKAIQNALRFIAELKGHDKEDVVYKPSTDFAELELSSQDLTALVNSWLQGALDHDTLLNNMREAGYIDGDDDNEEIKRRILASPPAVSGADGNSEDDEPVDENPEEEEGEQEEEEEGAGQ